MSLGYRRGKVPQQAQQLHHFMSSVIRQEERAPSMMRSVCLPSMGGIL